MPSEPTVDEVENLLDDIQHWGSIDDSRIPAKTRTILTALCRHYIAGHPKPDQCEHGITEGGWCEDCNREYKEAMNDPDNA